MDQCCGTCQLYALEELLDGKFNLRKKHGTATCTAEVPHSAGYGTVRKRPMMFDWGEDCPAYVKRPESERQFRDRMKEESK